MKKLSFPFTAIALMATFSLSTAAQPRFLGHNFNTTGVFNMIVSQPADLEASTNLQTWAKLASVSQEISLGDVTARQLDWRFYRLHGGSPPSSNALGYVKVVIPAGKMAILGNPFAAVVPLNTPDNLEQFLGTSNPAVKLSFYVNGKFETHTFDKTSGKWEPAVHPIRVGEGVSIENVGTSPLTVRFSGPVRQGPFNIAVLAGSSLLVPPVPKPGPLAQVLGIPGKDGMQIDIFNEQTQSHQTSTYDSLANDWLPKLPDYKPGRAFILKTPQALTWTTSYSVNAR